jgi:hypothetical protein
MHVAAKAQAFVQIKHLPRGGKGNPNPRVTNTGDLTGGKPKDKGPAANKGKAYTRPDKPKPRPHPKAEVEHETKGWRGEPPGRFLPARLRLHASSRAAVGKSGRILARAGKSYNESGRE